MEREDVVVDSSLIYHLISPDGVDPGDDINSRQRNGPWMADTAAGALRSSPHDTSLDSSGGDGGRNSSVATSRECVAISSPSPTTTHSLKAHQSPRQPQEATVGDGTPTGPQWPPEDNRGLWGSAGNSAEVEGSHRLQGICAIFPLRCPNENILTLPLPSPPDSPPSPPPPVAARPPHAPWTTSAQGRGPCQNPECVQRRSLRHPGGGCLCLSTHSQSNRPSSSRARKALSFTSIADEADGCHPTGDDGASGGDKTTRAGIGGTISGMMGPADDGEPLDKSGNGPPEKLLDPKTGGPGGGVDILGARASGSEIKEQQQHLQQPADSCSVTPTGSAFCHLPHQSNTASEVEATPAPGTVIAAVTIPYQASAAAATAKRVRAAMAARVARESAAAVAAAAAAMDSAPTSPRLTETSRLPIILPPGVSTSCLTRAAQTYQSPMATPRYDPATALIQPRYNPASTRVQNRCTLLGRSSPPAWPATNSSGLNGGSTVQPDDDRQQLHRQHGAPSSSPTLPSLSTAGGGTASPCSSNSPAADLLEGIRQQHGDLLGIVDRVVEMWRSRCLAAEAASREVRLQVCEGMDDE